MAGGRGFPGRGCSYGEMLDFLWPIQGRLGVRFGLKNIRECLRRLGRPERRFLSVHVAGTKGKGSTAAVLHAILDAAGHRAGLYISPHLVDFRERFVVGRQMAGPDEMVDVFQDVARATRRGQDPPLTFFEWCTAMAFLLFARRGVEVAVLEAGMGGRLDATRAAGGPLALFSLIGLDHQAYLGDTPEAIAREKAGLMTRGGAAVTAPQAPGVMDVLRRRAAVLGVELVCLGETARLFVHGTDLGGVVFDLVLPGRRLPRLFCPLPGRHQAGNAALAVSGLGCLERMEIGRAHV
jgi:dihydrofolate synthase/folylpolyglutamate synthase